MIINIKGQDIKFGYGLYFLGKAQEEYNTDISGLLGRIISVVDSDNITKTTSIYSNIIDLMYFSAKCESELDGVKLSITKRDLVNYIDDTNDTDNEEGCLATWSQGFFKSIWGRFQKPNEEEVESDEEVVKKK